MSTAGRATRRIVGCVLVCALLTLTVVAVAVTSRLIAHTTGCYALGEPGRNTVLLYPKYCPAAGKHDGFVAAGSILLAYVCSRLLARGFGPSVVRTGTMLLSAGVVAGLTSAQLAGDGAPWNIPSIAVLSVYVVGSVLMQLLRRTAPSLVFGARSLTGVRYAWRGGPAGLTAIDVGASLASIAAGMLAGLAAAALLVR